MEKEVYRRGLNELEKIQTTFGVDVRGKLQR